MVHVLPDVVEVVVLPAGADALLSVRCALQLRHCAVRVRLRARAERVGGGLGCGAARRAWVAWRRRRRRGSSAEKGEIMEGSSAVGRQQPPGSSSSLPRRAPPPPWAEGWGGRGRAARAWPRKTGLNWFIPALMKSSVGSSCGTTGDDGQWVCAARVSKNSTNLRRTCATDVNDCAACSFSKKATSAGIGSAGIVSSTASTADLRRTANLWRSRYDATSGARRASGGGDPGAPGSLDALLERCSACGRARVLRAAARELREDAAAFYQEGVRLCRHLLDGRVDRLGEPLGQLHVDHIRLGFLDAHRGSVGCDASQTGLLPSRRRRRGRSARVDVCRT